MTAKPDPTPLLQLLPRQRACRSYLPEPIDTATITAVLECATYAPSARNSQPWQFVVVTDPDRREGIWALATRAWEGGGSNTAGELPAGMHADVHRGMTGGFAGAPVTVVVGADLQRTSRSLIGSSLFPAVQNLLLGATAHGLGSALTTIATAYKEELAALVGFPDEIEPIAVIPLGRPAKELGPANRDPISEHAHREVFGQPWEP